MAASGIYSFVAVFWALPTALRGEATAVVGIARIDSIGDPEGFVGPQFFGLLADLTKSTVAGTYLSAAFVRMTTLLTICVPKRHEKATTAGGRAGRGPWEKIYRKPSSRSSLTGSVQGGGPDSPKEKGAISGGRPEEVKNEG